MKKWIITAVFVLAGAGQGAVALAQSLAVESAWARPTPPSAGVGGAFMRLRGGATADRLLSASSPAAEVLELHTHSMEGGVARMRAVSAIEVAPGAVVELRPGGFHLMLIRLKAPLKAGDEVPIRLRFEHAGEIAVRAIVSMEAPGAASAGAASGGHAADHSGHRH